MTDTSSIGPKWPPRATSHGRIKGIDTRGVVRDEEHWRDVFGTLEAFAERTSVPGAFPNRLSIRALVADELLARHHAELKRFGEALIPLSSTAVSLVYLGWNSFERQSDADDLKRAFEHIEAASERSVRLPAEVLARVEQQGFALRVPTLLERCTDIELQAGVAHLYRRFGWSAAETNLILAHPETLIAIGWEGERVVGAGIAEISHIALEDGFQLRIAEFSEAATLQSHQGRGLYSAICTTLMLELARRSQAFDVFGGELDLAFGECSGHDLGVLIAAKRLGRTFSRQVSAARALPIKGYLPQHVPIAGAPRSTRYNDLFPTFIDRRALYTFAESDKSRT